MNLQKLKFHGLYIIDHYRKQKFLSRFYAKNDITNEGKNLIFDVMFNDVTQIAHSAWCLGLINLSGFTALANTDVMNSHAGWAEFTGYSQANRVAWGSIASAAQSITNTTPAQFDINVSTATLKGIFITSNNTKGGTTGKLWSTALFDNDTPVVTGDQLKVTYTLNS